MVKSIHAKRSKYMGIGFCVLFILLSVRTYIVVNKYNPDRASVSMVNYQVENISQNNYMMLDSKGKDLMTYSKKYVVVIDSKPFSLNNCDDNMQNLLAFNFIMKTQVDNFSYDEILKKAGKSYFVVNEDTYNKVKNMTNIKGIYAYTYDESDSKNSWSITDLLSKVNAKDKYEEGSLEATLQSYIKNNKSPQVKFSLDKSGVYKEEGYEVNKDNKNIQLTLDLDLNNRIKNILNKSEYSSLKNAGVVIMDSESGDIKALVQKDESQPNLLIGAEGIGFEPASTFKLLVEQAALEDKDVSLSDKFVCKGEICQKDGKPYSHGTLSVRDALLVSCNDTFFQVAQKVGYDKLMKLAESEGLYSKALGLTKEISGTKPKEEAGLSNIGIGQAMTVTPVQMAGAINTIVNGGVYVKPSIVKSILDINDKPVNNYTSTKTRIISKTIADEIKENMREVVKKGTGTNAFIPNVDIGGKTGSATGAKGTTHGWFSGYFNIGKKYYTMVIFVPDINGKNEEGENLVGGNTGAPIFKDIVLDMMKNK
ncbi:penicillin-binding transpeptidase domain-containing protein [Clostridium sp. 'White wine YQ']|uniref:penicillin-binding transpeptidase domain-containing protein n=1 Tax=Clostridium sp. 'White wine YQ' TaxID=3027474 RepID=UPI0023656BC7|nr:penicillin-binding transpeptidase domain-containing protein [Clostridium sp. 'White wine YQ']MDD7793333.1 penicillin-binding transpeptidase domain-containing protein [Clostridium sp. 'White wine YQ']